MSAVGEPLLRGLGDPLRPQRGNGTFVGAGCWSHAAQRTAGSLARYATASWK